MQARIEQVRKMQVDETGSSRAVLIAGPTASGKSALALWLAEALGGEIINADSMQVYRELWVLTARPTPADEARAPHHLYGVLPAARACSAADWAALAMEAVREIEGRGRLPILVGGTGLYFRALTDGLAPVPAIPEAIRETVRAALAACGSERMHEELARVDPALAARLAVTDSQRIARGLEVAQATGRPLSEWHREPVAPLLAGRLARILLTAERDWLGVRCDARFDAMMAAGALDEARALQALDLDPALPAMKALGVPDLLSYLAGNQPFEAAVAAGKAQTRAYVKRQMTWLKAQMIAWNVFSAQFLEREIHEIFSFIDDSRLTGR